MNNDLPENVFTIGYKPTKEQANNKGDVLWFSRKFGWYKSIYQRPIHSDTTHWTYLPDQPEVEADPKAARDAAFAMWMSQFPQDFEAAAVALLKMGFTGGYETRGNA